MSFESIGSNSDNFEDNGKFENAETQSDERQIPIDEFLRDQLEAMKNLPKDDEEKAHIWADRILCDVLNRLA